MTRSIRDPSCILKSQSLSSTVALHTFFCGQICRSHLHTPALMRKVVIYTSGSRGDVQPYCALGLELVGRGAKVYICTEKRMEAFVKSFPELE